MFNLIKKDFLTLTRNRSEIILLLIMPSVLIVILGFSLGGMLNKESNIKEIPIALVNENNADQAIKDFVSDLIESGTPETVATQIASQASTIDPAQLFLNIIDSLETEAVFTINATLSQSQAMDALQKSDVAAVITLPQSFTYHSLISVFQGFHGDSHIEVIVGDKDAVSTTILQSILSRFTSEYNLQASVLMATNGVGVQVELPDNFGTVIHLPLLKSISSFQYYTVGMSMMFSLYVASSISGNAFKEKSNHTFSRIMVTGEKPIRYLMSKAISASLVACTQLAILFTTSTLLFNTFGSISMDTLGYILFASIILAITIGTLSALLTSIAQRFNTDSVSSVFSTFLISAFSFLGGSIIPTQMFSPLLGHIGLWTPNGAMMNVYLQLLRGQGLNDVIPLLIRMGFMATVFITIALIVFPKRRLV
ncbi:hypothetical protein AOC36_04315 [Erysipelothrix larvae]|uniref:ABC-2 type transporter transmembrane domain-containing protein n=1 Tax=Erysipelothrix larvae TaxID=1514105 RepID=A0A0X8GZD8_9FIRM|nr:ABC transporter permease [Erysipelothrix larvae]AMC93222.1 hypothetical protein AOC36_04315 [Erysipelothrix larvae]